MSRMVTVTQAAAAGAMHVFGILVHVSPPSGRSLHRLYYPGRLALDGAGTRRAARA